MSSEARLLRWIFPLALGLALGARAQAQSAAFDAWAARDDALFVLIVADGLRSDHLERLRPDGTPLMPGLASRRASALRFTHCESANVDLAGGAYQLLAATDFRGYGVARESAGPAAKTGLLALPDAGFDGRIAVHPEALREDALLNAATRNWRRSTAEAPRMLDEVLDAAGRQLVVLFTDVLLPPYSLEPELLDGLDPEPWVDAPENQTIEAHLRDRTRAARMAGERTDWAWAAGIEEAEGRAYARAVEAAHAKADAWIGILLERLDDAIGTGRACVALAANSSTALGEHGGWGVGRGAHHASVSVPLWIFLEGAAGSIEAPVLPADLAFTVTEAFGGLTDEGAGCVDLFAPIPEDRTRLHVAYASRQHDGKSEYTGAAGFCDGSLRFVQEASGEAFLFDMQNDPAGLVDLHGRHEALTLRSRQRLLEMLGIAKDADLARWLATGG